MPLNNGAKKHPPGTRSDKRQTAQAGRASPRGPDTSQDRPRSTVPRPAPSRAPTQTRAPTQPKYLPGGGCQGPLPAGPRHRRGHLPSPSISQPGGVLITPLRQEKCCKEP
ncbi:hypothetical protein NDU88_002491 [Pleurodeles waltl]|uniref:Uncharacterized protein n=1 Tax=Pleurodeles waltl TaxID=8319 RepID=A0AAV7LCM4_PLEWA|nr:hypothetical protein NDU88_002491 [Pleurodeles waltl]